MPHPYEQMLYDRFAQSILDWDTARYPDIYAISMLCTTFYSRDADEKEVAIQGQVSLSFNTLSHCETQIERAASAEEATWNFAFWLQNISAGVPRDFPYAGEPPLEELALRDAWCGSLGIPAAGADEGGRPTYNEPRLYEALRGACLWVAQALHQNEILLGKIGRPVPIVIHELERVPEAAAATRAANPPGLSREAEEWQLGRTYAQIEAYQALMQEIASRSEGEQIRFWHEAWLDFELQRPSDVTTWLQGMKRSKHDVINALSALGPSVIAELLPLVEEYALQKQYHLRSEPGRPRQRVWTPASRITEDVLRVIRAVGKATDEEVSRLHALLESLYRESAGKEWVGTNLSGVASTLHRLRPERYGVPLTGGRDNKLLNAAEFGLS